MKPISDYTIELLVRYPSALTEDVRRTVEEYVTKDPFGRAVAKFYRDYYRELDALEYKSVFRRDEDIDDLQVRIGSRGGSRL